MYIWTLEGASLIFQFQIRTQFSLPQATETNKKTMFLCRPLDVDSKNPQKKLLVSSTSDYFEAEKIHQSLQVSNFILPLLASSTSDYFEALSQLGP